MENFDLALVNAGFGVDQESIRDLAQQGVTPWFYNLENYRAAAGFYLWRSGARGYLQWHGRMPTADPFDPTDGREDDVQLLYPMAEPCPAVPELDRRLFELSEGIVDLRWLLWLEQQRQANPTAEVLYQKLQKAIPLQWDRANTLSPKELDRWREAIMALAY